MTREDYDDPLYRECVPHRLTPTPSSADGPTARWMAEHPEPDVVPQLRVVGE